MNWSKMTPQERRTAWIEALKSGKYEQGRRALKRGETYCCLGVLCDVSGMGRWLEEPDANVYERDGVKCVGISSEKTNLESGLTKEMVATLVRMNDKEGASFAEIVAQVRRWFPNG